jgi:hypothetical protein
MNGTLNEELAALDIVRQAGDLIQKFGIPITLAPPPNYGSGRYRSVVHAHDRLTRAEVQLSEMRRIIEWERSCVDGRNGQFLVSELIVLKNMLQRRGEGAPQPKARSSL